MRTSNYQFPSDLGPMVLTGPSVFDLSADDCREFAAFLSLILRQLERQAAKKEAAEVKLLPTEAISFRCGGPRSDQLHAEQGDETDG